LTTPLLTYVVDGLLRLDDATGLVVTAGAPALIGLLLAGVVADGAAGAGWQMTGLDAHLGVAGQGVSGLLVAQGFQPDFPGQFQAQLIGVAALILWGVIMGLLVAAPLGLLFWGLQHSERAAQARVTPPHGSLVEPEPTPSERRRVFPPFPSDPAT
jgi:Amt family ammonium transporter